MFFLALKIKIKIKNAWIAILPCSLSWELSVISKAKPQHKGDGSLYSFAGWLPRKSFIKMLLQL